MRRARITNWCGLVCLRMIVSSAWCCSFVNSMDAAANRAMLVSTSAGFIALQYRWYKLFRYPVLGIDEIALTRGHGNYIAVISTRDAQGHVSVLAVLPDRLKATVKAFLEAIPAPLKATIQTVCTDMYDGYTNAVS